MSETSSNYITALDDLRAEVHFLGDLDEGSLEQVRRVAIETAQVASRAAHAAFHLLDEHFAKLPRPVGYVGERIRVATSLAVGTQRWDALGTITTVVRPPSDKRHSTSGLYRVTFDGDKSETGGLWQGSSLTKEQA